MHKSTKTSSLTTSLWALVLGFFYLLIATNSNAMEPIKHKTGIKTEDGPVMVITETNDHNITIKVLWKYTAAYWYRDVSFRLGMRVVKINNIESNKITTKTITASGNIGIVKDLSATDIRDYYDEEIEAHKKSKKTKKQNNVKKNKRKKYQPRTSKQGGRSTRKYGVGKK